MVNLFISRLDLDSSLGRLSEQSYRIVRDFLFLLIQ